MELITLTIPFLIDPGGTDPVIKADEHNLEVSFYLLNSDDRGKIKFSSVLQFTFGYPNEEVISGHRYAKLGLSPFEFVEVKDSEIIKSIVSANRIHPYHRAEQFKDYKHYVFPFHDTTLEIIAKSYDFKK